MDDAHREPSPTTSTHDDIVMYFDPEDVVAITDTNNGHTIAYGVRGRTGHTRGEGSRRTQTHPHTAAQSAFLSPLHQKTDSDAADS
jgi:hypothetical protein